MHDLPMYVRLGQRLREGIEQAAMVEGTRLPSVRRLGDLASQQCR